MAPRRATKKSKKAKSRTVTGQILPPVDITNANDLTELDKRLTLGPITLVFVYADWCGHCQRFKPNMEELEQLNNRSVQIARIRDDVFPKSSINKTPIDGYPSLLLISSDKKPVKFQKENGEVTTVIPDHSNMQNMASIVVNAGTPQGLELLNKGNVKPAAINKVNGTPVINTAELAKQKVNEEEEEQASLNNFINTTPTKNTLSPSRPSSNTSALRVTGSTITYTPLTPSVTAATPPNIVVDRVTANQLTVAKNLVESASTPISQEGKKQQGGNYGLLNMLTKVAYEYGPAAALLYMANVRASNTSKSRKTRRKR